MKFTIKTAMIGMGLASFLVAVLFSRSPFFIGLVSVFLSFLIPMMLVFAICDGRKSRRPFWIGSFIMSVTCVYGSFSWGLFSSIECEIANFVYTVGSPSIAENATNIPPPLTGTLSVPTFPAQSLATPNAVQPLNPPVSTTFQPVAATYPAFLPTSVQGNLYIYDAIAWFVAIFLSVLVGVIGGFAALWISKIPPENEARQEEDSEPADDAN